MDLHVEARDFAVVLPEDSIGALKSEVFLAFELLDTG
jgi:hypothetical protein